MAEAGRLPVSYLISIQHQSIITRFSQIRLYLMGNVPSDEYWGNRLPRLINYGKHGRLNLRSVKLYADGMMLLVAQEIHRSLIWRTLLRCSWVLGRCSTCTLLR